MCASLSHTQYWYEVGMLKVPAVILLLLLLPLIYDLKRDGVKSVVITIKKGGP